MGWVPWGIAAAAAAAALLSWARQAPTVAPTAPVDGHFTIELPQEAPVVTSDIPRWADIPLAVSPDGRTVVYVAPNGRGTQLFARGMADLAPRPIAGSDGARSPFLSPDGQWVGFFAGGKLKKLPLAGGTPVTLADAPQAYGGSWGDNGEIVFAPGTRGLFAVREEGGTPRQVTSLAPGDDLHVRPQRLPGNPVVLFTVIAWSRETTLLAAVNLDTGARSVVQEEAAFGRYVPGPNGSAGHVAFVRDGALMIGRFDPARAGHASPPLTVLDGVDDRSFDASSTGVLVYAPGTGKPVDYSLVWVDRAGNATTINDLPRGYEDLNLSPDGRLVALTVEESGPESPASVWLADVTRRTVSRFTFDGFSRDPVWAADGQSIVFGGKRGENSVRAVRAAAGWAHAGRTGMGQPRPDLAGSLFVDARRPHDHLLDEWREDAG